MIRKVISVFIVYMATPNAADAAITCAGPVVAIEFAADGLLKVNSGYGENQLCYVDKSVTKETGPYGALTITKEYCQSLLSNFVTAKASGKQVQISWDLPVCPTGQDPGRFPFNFRF